MTPPDNFRSRAITEGLERAPNRAMLRAVGFKDGDFVKPIVGIANAQSTITPCNSGLQKLAREQDFGFTFVAAVFATGQRRVVNHPPGVHVALAPADLDVPPDDGVRAQGRRDDGDKRSRYRVVGSIRKVRSTACVPVVGRANEKTYSRLCKPPLQYAAGRVAD